MRITCYMFILALASSPICSAQNVFCMGGDLDHLTHDERAVCQTQMTEARHLANRYRGVQDWHFVVVCGESSWKAYSSFAHERTSYLSRAVADTDQAERVTFLRGASLSSHTSGLPDPRVLEALSYLDAQGIGNRSKTANSE